MKRKVKAVQFGCGPIGISIVKYAKQTMVVDFVGAIDIDKSLIGRDLGEVSAMSHKLGVYISADADAVLSQAKPDIVFLTTSSSLKAIYPQIKTCLEAGANVISTCEELAYPYYKNPELSADIDKIAKKHQVSILGTGVNPGFLMDVWPLFMTGVCQQVKKIKVVRVQDVSKRRGPFQKKIGAGRTLKEFKKLEASGVLRHVGLSESIAMVADQLGWKLDEISESIEPVMANTQVKTNFVTVAPGQVAGVKQLGKGIRSGETLITLEFIAFVGAPESYDAVYISGIPDLEIVINGGTPGDVATAAMVVNSIPIVLSAPPGLLTMKDIPLVSALGIRD